MTRICVNFSTVYNDTLIAKGLTASSHILLRIIHQSHSSPVEREYLFRAPTLHYLTLRVFLRTGCQVTRTRSMLSSPSATSGSLRTIAPIRTFLPRYSSFGIVNCTNRWFRASSTTNASKVSPIPKRQSRSSIDCPRSTDLFFNTSLDFYRWVLCHTYLVRFLQVSHM